MSKERFKSPSAGESNKEFLKKWAKRLGLIAVGLLGLSWLMA